MATPEQHKLLDSLWTVGMKVPDLVRKVKRRVPLRAVQAWARARRLSDAGATEGSAQVTTGSKSRGKVRKLPAWMQAASDSGRSREQLRAVGRLGLTTQQLDALTETFWTKNRGAIGVRQLYEQLRDDPRQRAAMEASGGKEGWLSWREVRRWYAIWAPPQTMRRAPAVSQTRAVLPKTLEPYAYMQSDVLDMGSWARPEGATASQQYRYVVVTIDSVTRFVWLCTFRGKLTNAKVARCLEKVVKSARERYGAWPRKTVLRTDNGRQDFGDGFTTALRGIEPLIRHEHGVASRPNSQALAEGAVGIARGVLRRMYKAYNSTDWPTMLPEANGIMNNRRNAALSYVSPADLLDAFQDGDTAVVDKAMSSLRKRAGLRRGPGGTVDTALSIGTRVRLANEAYMKAAGMRGNTLKSIPRWSERIYTIDQRRGGGASPYMYRLEGRPKKDVYPRELLQVVVADLPPPPEASAEREEYEIARVLRVTPTRALVLYSGYPEPEWTPIGNVPANLLPP
jgi:hypothetical protein